MSIQAIQALRTAAAHHLKNHFRPQLVEVKNNGGIEGFDKDGKVKFFPLGEFSVIAVTNNSGDWDLCWLPAGQRTDTLDGFVKQVSGVLNSPIGAKLPVRLKREADGSLTQKPLKDDKVCHNQYVVLIP